MSTPRRKGLVEHLRQLLQAVVRAQWTVGHERQMPAFEHVQACPPGQIGRCVGRRADPAQHQGEPGYPECRAEAVERVRRLHAFTVHPDRPDAARHIDSEIGGCWKTTRFPIDRRVGARYKPVGSPVRFRQEGDEGAARTTPRPGIAAPEVRDRALLRGRRVWRSHGPRGRRLHGQPVGDGRREGRRRFDGRQGRTTAGHGSAPRAGDAVAGLRDPRGCDPAGLAAAAGSLPVDRS